MNLKNNFSTIAGLFSGKFVFFASLASILGLVILIIKDDWAIFIALSFFCLMLLVFTSYLLYLLSKILNINESDHDNRSTFVKYETLDGNTIIYETYKLIQV